MEIHSPDFEYNLIAEKGEERKEFSGKECMVDFKNSGIEGLTKIGWENKDRSIFANLIDGSFEINGKILVIDLGVSGKDKDGNIKILSFDEMKLEPIWFRRIREDYKPEGKTVTVKYCIGYKTNIDGKVYQKILLIDEDGTTTLSDRK
jgi:hypothetical protein